MLPYLIQSVAQGVPLPYFYLCLFILFGQMLLFSWDYLLLFDARDDATLDFRAFLMQLWSCLDHVIDLYIHDIDLIIIPRYYLHYDFVNDLLAFITIIIKCWIA